MYGDSSPDIITGLEADEWRRQQRERRKKATVNRRLNAKKPGGEVKYEPLISDYEIRRLICFTPEERKGKDIAQLTRLLAKRITDMRWQLAQEVKMAA